MKNLLISTDFSVNSTSAAIYGYHLAMQLHANIVLCHAINTVPEVPQIDFVAWPMAGEDILKSNSDKELKNLKIQLELSHPAEEFNPVINCVNSVGTVEEVIRNTVENFNIDMILMGIHQGDNLIDFFVGNHSQHMITRTTVPLLLIPAIAPKVSVHRIAFATDLKQIKIDLEHIYALIAFAKPINADILITYVGDNKTLSPLAEQRNEELLTEISNKADYPHIYYKFLNNSSVEEALEWICKHEQISILAMVPRRRHFIEGILNGSLTQKMAKHLSIPLLVFPPK